MSKNTQHNEQVQTPVKDYSFSPQQIANHVKALESYYDDPMGTKNFLGESRDPNFKYAWCHINHPTRKDEYRRYCRIGYAPVATDEVDFDPQSMAPSHMGGSVVIVEHRNGDLMQLMKIPMTLWQITQNFKRAKAEGKAVLDADGNPNSSITTSKSTISSRGDVKIIHNKVQASDYVVE